MTTVGDMFYHMGGVPVNSEFTTGSIFFVDSNTGSNSNDGKSPDTPLATLDYAIGQCTATKGDIIYLMPGHAETTTAIAADVAGVTIKGIGRGRAKPAFTATTAASDLIDVSAANVSIENVRFVGAASGCTALVDVGAADAALKNCNFEHGAAPVMAITCASGSSRIQVLGCYFLGTADGPDCAIDMESNIDDFVIKDCIMNYGAVGCDLGCIRANAHSCEGGVIDRCTFIGMDTVAIDFNSSDTANIAGVISNCVIGMGAATANIDTAIDAGSYGIFETVCTDIVAERGGLIPVTSPA